MTQENSSPRSIEPPSATAAPELLSIRFELAKRGFEAAVREGLDETADRPNPDSRAMWAQLNARIGQHNKTMSQPASALTHEQNRTGFVASSGSNSLAARYKSWQHTKSSWFTGVSVFSAILFLVVGWQAGILQVNARMHGRASVYTTGNGERAKITLPDGSTVVLSVASRLEVPAAFAIDNREVRLSGEAFFTVVHESDRPFTVKAGESVTRVLGTSFVVRHYEADSAALVAVRDGRVAVDSVVVNAQEQVIVQNGKVSSPYSASEGQFTFAGGVLTLSEQRLDQAIVELNRWYNADIQLGDSSIGDRLIRGRFGAGSLTDLIEYLEWTFKLRVERDGQRLTLYPKP